MSDPESLAAAWLDCMKDGRFEDAWRISDTLRSTHPEAFDPTWNWLDHNEFPPGELKCQWEDKIPLIADCQYIIDDRPS